MFDFIINPLSTLRLWKHCVGLHNKDKVDPYQDLIDNLIALVEPDSIEGQSFLSDNSLDWYDVSPEISNEPETQPSTSSECAKIETEKNDPIPSEEFTPQESLTPSNQHGNMELDQSDNRKEKQQVIATGSDQVIPSNCLPSTSLNTPVEINRPESSNGSPIAKSGANSVASDPISLGNSPEKMETKDDDQQPHFKDEMKLKRLANRLDVSQMSIQAALAVIVEEKGWKQDGARSKRIFDSIYETLGKNADKIASIAIKENCIKIYTVNVETRSIILRELKDMNQLIRETSPFQLYVQNPLKPSIQFLCSADTFKLPSCDLISLIRKENNWKSEWTVNIESKEWIRKLRKAKLSLMVDSRIRDKIEMEDGIISVAGKETKVFDKFGISQCSICLRFGHSKCRSRVRCFFCSGFHSDRYRHDKQMEKKFCFLCRVIGHAPISKSCPVLIEEIRSKLELIEYKYKTIFVGTDRSY